ncbi:acyl-phosphate glycerol 3-phosphate acyltransferase [Slackia faecicanis]|uniref:Glycerol-3-phosphate acyltransferase n=1 Tax=Slackia faecicanis TaxID=255723 RepID=A0A3N0AHH6_9ACTN|nr:glycerol-3-phosphate 1-O-acyltransferase PlsY [Slackia faecicanis]RNL21515.1 acyl-phosphate glycerol 3-phosphate acyltransferase [Slackia faecicanis]
MPDVAVALGVFAVSFLLGSIPWGLIISKVVYHTDIREHGSGNIGTTNAMRTMGKAGGVAVFLLDFGKGLVSGALGLAAMNLLASDASIGSVLMGAIATAGCTLGHIFSPWLGFRGGKGIAVAIGALCMTFGPLGAFIEVFCIFAPLVLITRYVSVGSIASAALCPAIACFLYWGQWPAIVLYGLTGATVVWAHRANIKRLAAGTESRIGAKKRQA